MSQPRKMVPDRVFAPFPKARNGRQVHYLTASIAAGVLALLGGCGEKIEAEPPFVSPDPFEARVRRELFELKSKLDEVQTGQAILVEALSRQNFELDREFIEALKNNSGITLQWIETEQRGKLTVTESSDGVVSMSGKQVSEDGRDIILIEGQVVLNTPSAFVMLGTIDVDLKRYREEGMTRCRREGAFTFRRTGDRQYWRLLEKSEHCDYGTDYIDIFL